MNRSLPGNPNNDDQIPFFSCCDLIALISIFLILHWQANWSRFMCIEFLISSTKKWNDFCFGGELNKRKSGRMLLKRERKKWMKSCCHHQRDVRSQILSVLKENLFEEKRESPWRGNEGNREYDVRRTGKDERLLISALHLELTLTMSRENLCCSFEVERINDVKAESGWKIEIDCHFTPNRARKNFVRNF